MKLAWNAIVKNEEARIERCVNSLLPHIDYAVVVDTGSEDQTLEKMSRLFAQAGKPFEIYYASFENFSQARNVALQKARESKLPWDYLLLADADMELKVEQPFMLNGGLAYDMQQRAGSLVYFNRRLVSRKAEGWYMGVTHEYLDVQSAGSIDSDSAWFIDHADGANRPDKIKRDVALLEEALHKEINLGLIQRYHFYLANSYFELGRWQDAAVHYKRRVEMGGWNEEQWYAQFRYALCLRHMGDQPGFLWEMLAAYRMRPQRAEVLYELAKHFRERGDNLTSLLFSEAGMQLPNASRDVLFVNDWVYKSGLREEFAICAYYDERRRRTGGKEANKLALAGSEQARFNLFWYLQPLAEAVPSFRAQPIGFTPLDGWAAMNPSVINYEGHPLFLVRTVNYAITSEGRYVIRNAPDAPVVIRTRNFIGSGTGDWHELELPENWPTPPQFPLVLGFEDSRLLQWLGQIWTLSTVRELTPQGWCEQVLAPLVRGGHRWRYGNGWRQIESAVRVHQKNWMPWTRGDDLLFVYRLGTLVDLHGEMVAQFKPEWAVEHISGGSQVVKVDDRTHLAIVHEARTIPGRPNRYYQHRFVEFLADGRVQRISPPFFFHDRQIEFAAGLAYFPEKKQLMVSYGVRDCEPWMATMDVDDVISFIYGDAS